MARGVSLHIGLNEVDPARYAGWAGILAGPESDADAMLKICTSQGFSGQVLKSKAATREAVISRLEDLARSLTSGDKLILTYSGHGNSNRTDLDGDEHDGMDETWCLFDGQLVDDELRRIWGKFAAGVRVLVITDSCHNGSVIWTPITPVMLAGFAEADRSHVKKAERSREKMVPFVARKSIRLAQAAYFQQIAALPPAPPPVCTVALLAACLDRQTALDGYPNSLFTGALLKVWRNGSFAGSYRKLMADLAPSISAYQTPTIMAVDSRSRALVDGKAFGIA